MLAHFHCHLVGHSVGICQDATASQGSNDKAGGRALGLLMHLPRLAEIRTAGDNTMVLRSINNAHILPFMPRNNQLPGPSGNIYAMSVLHNMTDANLQ